MVRLGSIRPRLVLTAIHPTLNSQDVCSPGFVGRCPGTLTTLTEYINKTLYSRTMFAARPVSSSFRTPGRVRTRSATCIPSIQPSSMRLLPSLCPVYSSSLHSALEVRHPCYSVPFYLSSVSSLVRPIARTSHRLCPLFHLIDVVPAGHLSSPQEVL